MVSNPVMLITGTTRGIGQCLTKHYTNCGYNVIGCSRNETSYKSANYRHFCLDISEEASVKILFREIRKVYGRLDVLINNAGISSNNHVLLTSLDEAHNAMETNFIGTFLLCREAVKIMKRNKYGRIINVSSVHVPLALEGTSIYGASKAATEQLSKVLAKEIYPFGITVNILSLSVVKESGMVSEITIEAEQNILNRTITKKQLDSSHIIHSVDFLISEKSCRITGQNIHLGGI